MPPPTHASHTSANRALFLTLTLATLSACSTKPLVIDLPSGHPALATTEPAPTILPPAPTALQAPFVKPAPERDHHDHHGEHDMKPSEAMPTTPMKDGHGHDEHGPDTTGTSHKGEQ